LLSLIAVSLPIAIIAILQSVAGYGGLLGSREQQLIAGQGLFATFWPSLQRASATFASNNAAGAFFAASALVALLHALLLRGGRLAYLSITAAVMAGLALTFSRGAIFGLLAGLFFVVCTIGRARLQWIVGLSVPAVLLALFAFVPLSQVLGYLRVDDDLLSASVSRVNAWHGAWEMIQQHPLSGIGFYQFKETMATLEGDSDAPAHPHNGVLKATVEEGLLGGIVYLGYFAFFVKTAASSIRRFRNRPKALWIFCSIAVIGICLFAQELVDAGLTMGGSSIAILFSICLGVQTSFLNFLEV
jgi:O-antigen ligase